MAKSSLSVCLSEIKANPNKFYVYVLSRPDGSPFYVGCGKVQSRGFQRITFHEREAKAGIVTTHKCNTIRAIWKSVGLVQYAIDSWHNSNQEMFAREIELISKLGRADLGTGRLTNWTAGGEGLVDRSDEVRRRASKTMLSLVTADWRKQSSKRTKSHWDSEDGRAKRLAANDRPESKKARHLASKRQNANPEIIKRKSTTMLATWQTPEYQEKQNAALRAALSTPEYKAKKGAQAAARWSDPEYRERLRAAHRARWQLRKSKNQLSFIV